MGIQHGDYFGKGDLVFLQMELESREMPVKSQHILKQSRSVSIAFPTGVTVSVTLGSQQTLHAALVIMRWGRKTADMEKCRQNQAKWFMAWKAAVSWGKINQNWPRNLRDSNIHVYYSYWVIEKYLCMGWATFTDASLGGTLLFFFAVRKSLSCKSLISLWARGKETCLV